MFCHSVLEFLAQKGIEFEARDVSTDPKALEALQELGYLTTPVTTIGDEVVVGFDRKRLQELLSAVNK